MIMLLRKKDKRVKLQLIDIALRDYITAIESTNSIKIIHKDLTYSQFFNNKMLIIHSIRHGLSYELFRHIKEVTPFSDKDWANYLNLSERTLQRNKQEVGFRFKSIHSEKIIELAEVTQFGKEVFDSKEQFYSWLHIPSYALGNLKPAELLRDSYGKELVMAELNRIEHGIFV